MNLRLSPPLRTASAQSGRRPTILPALLLSGSVLGAATNAFKPVLSATLTERYDNNVMLQNQGGQARQDSWATSVLPVLGGRLTGTSEDLAYAIGLQYTPDFTFFHQLSRESYLRHIGVFDFDLKHKGFSANASLRGQYTDGGTAPPDWGSTSAGDQVPALGAPEVRNRRRNAQWVTKVVGQQDAGRFFLRGVFEARIWDFMTEDTFVPDRQIQNYYDRSDINGGFDAGWKVHAAFEPYLGYRLGHQEQEFRERPPFNPSAPSYSYANQYHRFFLGAVSRPVSRVSLNGEFGPSLHYFDGATIPAGTHTEQDFFYFQAGATVQLGSNTTFRASGSQSLMPASAGNGVFQWLSASGSLTQRFAPKCQGAFRFAFTEYDFDADFQRRDQSYVAEGTVEYAVNKRFSARAWYAYEWSVNLLNIPNGAKREYDRHVAGIGVRARY